MHTALLLEMASDAAPERIILGELQSGVTLAELGAYGGGRMPQVVIERALKLLPHVDFVNAYGLTETSSRRVLKAELIRSAGELASA